MSEKKIVICDIDGTIANNDHRQHFLEGKKDWDGFFSKLNKDLPIYSVIKKVIELHKQGKKIIFLTGRPEKYVHSTELWLKEHFDFSFEIISRQNNDRRNKISVKMEMFEKNLNKKDVYLVIENDLDLLKMWDGLGMKTLNANLMMK